MPRALCQCDGSGLPDYWLQHQPIDRRAFSLRLFDVAFIRGQCQRNLSRGNQIRQQRMSFAKGIAVSDTDILEQPHTFALTQVEANPSKPVEISCFDANCAPWPAQEQILVGTWQFIRLELYRAVTDCEYSKERSGPFAMGRYGLYNQILRVRRCTACNRFSR